MIPDTSDKLITGETCLSIGAGVKLTFQKNFSTSILPPKRRLANGQRDQDATQHLISGSSILNCKQKNLKNGFLNSTRQPIPLPSLNMPLRVIGR